MKRSSLDSRQHTSGQRTSRGHTSGLGTSRLGTSRLGRGSLLALTLSASLRAPAAYAQSPGVTAVPPAGAAAASAAPPAASAISAAPASRRTVLVQRLQASGVALEVARNLEEALLAELGKRSGVAVISPAELEQTVELARTQAELGCDDVDACLAEVQHKLRAGELITGKVGRVGPHYALTVGLVDVSSRVVGRRVAAQALEPAQLKEQLPGLVDELLGIRSQAPAFRLAQGSQIKLAVMPLAALGVPAATADAMTQILAAEYNQVQGVSVISKDDIQAMLSQIVTLGQLGCLDKLECVAEIGAALGLSQLVTGSVGKVEGTYIISARLIDTRRAEVVNRVVEAFEGDTLELRHAVKIAAYRLLGVDIAAQKGRADFTFNVGQGSGQLGTQPFRFDNHQLALGNLAPGRYPLRVVPLDTSYVPLRTDVYIPPGLDNVRSFALQETPPKWYSHWWVWAIAGSVLAAGMTTAIIVSNQDDPKGIVEARTPGAGAGM